MSDEAVRPLILLVEDNPDDIELTRIALEEAGVPCDIAAVEDGADALEYLQDMAPTGQRPRPHLVLLDLNLPKVDGRDVLRTMKGDPSLASIPVIVLTTSGDDHDIRFSYGNHANAFMIKPIDFEQYVRVVRSVAEFWFATVILPPMADPYDPYGD